VLSGPSSKRFIILAFVATVLVCAVVAPIEASRLSHTFRKVDRSEAQARADLDQRTHRFGERVSELSVAAFPADGVIAALGTAGDVDLSVTGIDHDHGLVVDVRGFSQYGIIGQASAAACFRVSITDPGAPATVRTIPCP
jgi:hypothetical protein